MDDLRVMKTVLGSGYVLGGTHPSIQGDSLEFSSVAAMYRMAKFCDRGNLTLNAIKKVNPIVCNTIVKGDFFEGEAVGLNVPPRCNRCTNCTSCIITDANTTMEELLELEILRKCVKFDDVDAI